MANIKGDLTSGLSQSEEDFDYENFTPTSPPKIEKETESSSESLFGELDNLDLNLDGPDSMDLLSSNNETLQRASRYTSYPQSGTRNQDPRITEIKTICPYEKKRLYESIGLSCSDLRKSIKEFNFF